MSIPRDVKTAVELLRLRPERALTLKELASSCGVAPRTLQKHFKQFIGKSPGQVRLEARLDQARRELLRAKPNVSVADIASSCGIGHLGRFAGLYKKQFGETPSATLARRTAGSNRGAGPVIAPSRLDRPIVYVHRFDCADGTRGLDGRDVSEGVRAGLARDRWLALGPLEHARYHVHGNMLRELRAVRLTVTLTSKENGRCVWAERWQGPPDNLVQFEERVATRIAAAIQRSLLNAEIDRAAFKDPAQANAWELTMKAIPSALRVDGASLTHALELLERAIELAPMDSLPIAWAAWCRTQRGGHNFSPSPTKEKACGVELAARGARLANDDPIAESLFGGAFAMAGDLERAALHINKALAMDGGCAWAWNRLGLIEIYRGSYRDATEAFRIARGLDPFNPLDFICSVGTASAHVDAGRYDEGARLFADAIAKHPEALWINRFRAPALLRAGRVDEARRAFADLTEKHPDLSIAAVRQAIPYTQSHWDLLAEGLADLGMPL